MTIIWLVVAVVVYFGIQKSGEPEGALMRAIFWPFYIVMSIVIAIYTMVMGVLSHKDEDS